MATIVDKDRGFEVEIIPMPAVVYKVVMRDTDDNEVVASRVFLTREHAVSFRNQLLDS